MQNFPVLDSAIGKVDELAVTGSFNSIPNNKYLIQFFANNTRNVSKRGEGEFFIGQIEVTTDANGDADILFTCGGIAPACGPNSGLVLAPPKGIQAYFIATTATIINDDNANNPLERFGDTSEFSLNVKVKAPE